MPIQRILLTLCCTLVLLLPDAQADAKSDSCSPFANRLTQNFEELANCECNSNGFDNRLPEGGRSDILPVAICDFHVYEGGNRGRYYYNLDLIIVGKVIVEVPSEVEIFHLEVDEKMQQSLPRLDSNLRFFDTSESVKLLLNIPYKGKRNGCWEAPASIRVSQLQVNSINGQDEDGIYAEKFKLIKVGKYKSCPTK